MPKRRTGSKYGNKRTKVDGRSFHSKVEAQRYLELKERERKGVIERLECQPRFDLVVNGVHICRYYADFRYYANNGEEEVIEDVKGGIITADFKMKAALLLATEGLVVEIVKKRSRNRTNVWFVDGVQEPKMYLPRIDNSL